ncbi:MAG: hypothetical protein SOT60_10385 [Bilifractor sp.]|nr:hypothetical protein [Lachnospiraceae bacterium]MDY2838323.1 hypothetical protein [Bilifractor sp.]
MTFDFAEILYLGLQFGLRKNEIGCLTYREWADLYKQYRKEWNMKAKNAVYSEDEKISSSLDL